MESGSYSSQSVQDMRAREACLSEVLRESTQETHGSVNGGFQTVVRDSRSSRGEI